MKMLIACECSQTICKEFRLLGHEAYSCDIEPCYGGHPEWHIVGDCLDIINGSVNFMTEDGINHSIYTEWDLIIAHPPCTYLSNAATSKHSLKSTTLKQINARTEKRIRAQEFFMQFTKANCDKFAESENDKENYQTKRTCLWLKGLQTLKINDLPRPDIKAIYGTWSNGKARCWHERVSTDKARVRSKTFRGIAKAMAEQWGKEMK